MTGRHRRTFRNRRLGVVAAMVAVAFGLAMPARAATPIDTTSTTGVPIETVPALGTGTAQVVGGSDAGWVALTTGVWRGSGTGYPQAVVPPNENPNISIMAISDTNIVAGNYLAAGNRRRAFVLRPDGTFLTLPSPPGDSGVIDIVPVAVADDGAVIGRFNAFADTCRTIAAVCGFLATPDAGGDTYSVETFTTPEDLPFLPTVIGGTGDDVIVAGGGQTWTRAGGYQDLAGVVPGRNGTARSINASGALTGEVSPEDGVVQAAYWASPTAVPVVIPAVGSDEYRVARDINDSNQVVGWSGASSSPAGVRHAYVWDAANGTRDLGTLPGGTSAEAMAITEDGLVIGESNDRPVVWDLDDDFDLDQPPDVGIVSLPPRNVEAGDPVVIELVVDDLEGDPYEFAIDGLPDGSYDIATDTFRWDTTADDVGTYSFTFTVRQIDAPANAYVLPFRLPLTVEPGTVAPTVQIDLTENVAVIDDVAVRPAVQLAIGESITVTDDVSFDLAPAPVTIAITEVVEVTDAVDVRPSVLLVIGETVTVTDDVDLGGPPPPIRISLSEPIEVSDDVAVRPSVLLTVSETVTVDDAAAPVPAVLLRVGETVGVLDDVTIDVRVPEPDGDGDGIADVIDGRTVGGTFVSDAATPSDDFDDRHRSGTTYGSIVDRAVLDPTVADLDSGGVRVMTGPGASTERADFDLCGLPGLVRVLPSSSVVVRCGSLFATVEAGGIEIQLSDGAFLAVDAPGSVVVRDDGASIEIEVFTAPARLVDGGAVDDLAAGDIVIRPDDPTPTTMPPNDAPPKDAPPEDTPMGAPATKAPAPARPVAPVTPSGPLAITGWAQPIGTLVSAAVSFVVLGLAATLVAQRRRRRIGAG